MKLNCPNLAQLLYLAQHMTDAEVQEYVTLSGMEFDPESHALRCYSYNGPAHVLYAEGKPYYVGGFLLTSPHVANAWSIATDECSKHVLEMTRTFRAVIKGVLQGGVHRIHMGCLESRTPARRWYEAIGASHEATLRGAGENGENLVIYSILKEQSHV